MSSRRKSSITSLIAQRGNLKKSKKPKSGSSKGTSGGISADGKQARINIWPEWSENDVNNEKWEMTSKANVKDKTKSPQPNQNLFDDPDGRLRLPPSLNVAKWRRASDYFTKIPVVVDCDSGVHDFDIFKPNEHLFASETMRWLICQINTLWTTSVKKAIGDAEIPTHDGYIVGSDGLYHTWKFWEHICSLNKVGKGLPQYNPAGKYIVKLFWMGEWRKIYVDDNLPFDEFDRLLLPVTSLGNELWSIILSKALLKIASLSYGFATNDTEFGDFNVIHALTGWIPQIKIITKEHRNQIWTILGDLLCHWTYDEEDKPFVSIEKVENALSPENQDSGHDKVELKETNTKDKKDKKDIKDNKVKDKKDKEKEKEKSKPVVLEGNSSNTNPETIIFASFKSNSTKLNMLGLSKMADHSEALRKIGLTQTYSHPVLLNYYRDCPLIRPKLVESVPAWKLIRPMVKPEVPLSNDCSVHYISGNNKVKEDINDLQMIEIETPFLNYKISNNTFPGIYSRGSKSSITDIIEDACENDQESPSDVFANIEEEKEFIQDLEIKKKKSNAVKSNSINQISNKHAVANDDILEEISDKTNGEKINDSEYESVKSWIDINNFCECFQALYIYHKPETYRYSETITDSKTNMDQKEPIYLYVDNSEGSEIIFCLSAFCKWLPTIENHIIVDNLTNRNSPPISIIKDTNNEVNYIENEGDINNQSAVHLCSFIAENHCWKSFKVGNIFKRARTNGTKAISLRFPPGRYCLRIFIECKNGFHCKVISQDQFYLKNEDLIMPLFTEVPKRLKDFALNIVLHFNKIIESFSNIEERKNHEKSFIDLIIPFNKNHEMTSMTSKITQIFGESLLNVINQLNNEILSQDMIFALRALTLCFENNSSIINVQSKQSLGSNRNSAKGNPVISSKIDSRKQSSTKSIVNQENKDDRKIEAYNKEYSEENIIQIQKYFKALHVRKVMNSRDPQSNNHDRVITELKKLVGVIEQNSLKYGTCILNDIADKCPQIFSHTFENDKLNHIALEEYSGCNNSLSGSGFEIIFREIFYINNKKLKLNLIAKLNCSAPKCTLMVINNDNRETFSDSIVKRLHLSNLQPNSKGYTFVSFVKEAESIINWKLKLICDGNDILPKPQKQELCSDFSVTKIRDYFIPNRHGVLFHQLIKVKDDHLVTIYVKLSNPNASFRLSIYNYEEELYSVDGRGEVLIPSFIFLKDEISDVGSGRSPSRTSNKSKKNLEKLSARNSRTDSSCSGDEQRANKYSIKVYVDNKTWLLTEANKKFAENLQRVRKKEMAENKNFNENQTKSSQNIDLSKKEGASKLQTKGKGKEKAQDNIKITKGSEKSSSKVLIGDATTSRPNSNSFESDKAHWIFYLTSDASLEDNIQIMKNNEKYENLFAIKKVWAEMDPLRFDKGKQIQSRYIEENRVQNNQEEIDQNSEIILKPLDTSIYYRKDNAVNGDNSSYEANRIKSIEEFRQHQIEWNLWCQNEKIERNKNIINNLNEYNKLQEAVNSHRSDYYKVRENIRRLNQNSIKNTEIKNN